MAVIAACGVDPHVWAHIPEMAALHRDCKELTTVGRSVGFYLDDGLPEDAHERCTGRCFISITSLFPFLTPSFDGIRFEGRFNRCRNRVDVHSDVDVSWACLHRGMVCATAAS